MVCCPWGVVLTQIHRIYFRNFCLHQINIRVLRCCSRIMCLCCECKMGSYWLKFWRIVPTRRSSSNCTKCCQDSYQFSDTDFLISGCNFIIVYNETASLTLKEERRLRVNENKVLRKIHSAIVFTDKFNRTPRFPAFIIIATCFGRAKRPSSGKTQPFGKKVQRRRKFSVQNRDGYTYAQREGKPKKDTFA
jgi:hypothetical protein